MLSLGADTCMSPASALPRSLAYALVGNSPAGVRATLFGVVHCVDFHSYHTNERPLIYMACGIDDRHTAPLFFGYETLTPLTCLSCIAARTRRGKAW
jgi:hypothetical protein